MTVHSVQRAKTEMVNGLLDEALGKVTVGLEAGATVCLAGKSLDGVPLEEQTNQFVVVRVDQVSPAVGAHPCPRLRLKPNLPCWCRNLEAGH